MYTSAAPSPSSWVTVSNSTTLKEPFLQNFAGQFPAILPNLLTPFTISSTSFPLPDLPGVYECEVLRTYE